MASSIGTPVGGTGTSPGNVTVPSGAELAVLTVWNNGPAPTGAALGGTGLTLIEDAATFVRGVACFYIVNPAAGTPALTLTVPSPELVRWYLEFFEGVDTAAPVVEAASAVDNDVDFNGNTFSLATAVGDLVRVAGIVFSGTAMTEVGVSSIVNVTDDLNATRQLGGMAGDADGVSAGYEVTTEANWALVAFVVATAPPPAGEITRHRWRNDDGTEATATWAAAADATVTAAAGETRRLRIQQNGYSDPAASRPVRLQFRRVGDADWIEVN